MVFVMCRTCARDYLVVITEPANVVDAMDGLVMAYHDVLSDGDDAAVFAATVDTECMNVAGAMVVLSMAYIGTMSEGDIVSHE